MATKKSKVTYGKLVERILTFRTMGVSFADELLPLADARLEELRSFWCRGDRPTKMAVFGDASSSMQTAIEAATIFASMVSVCFDGELSFFGSDLIPSPCEKPKNVRDALHVCNKVRAWGSTSLAAALWPYYESKKKMDVFVMVTDEGENTPKNGHSFAGLLAKYRREVNPDVFLVVVRVGCGERSFQQDLERNEIHHRTVILDGERPDHAKFDALLGQLALLSSNRTVDLLSGVDGEDVEMTSSCNGSDEGSNSKPTEDQFVMV